MEVYGKEILNHEQIVRRNLLNFKTVDGKGWEGNEKHVIGKEGK